ncbi:MAG: RluA family pseudouridine synthase [Lachnospiraceae bacterium]|nr:RluA family pseudouridine synthase [Lachnospiraceae bacterium]
MEQINIGKNDDGRRVDAVVARYLPAAGKAFIYKMLRKKNIVLNGKKAEGSERVTQGNVVTLYLADETIAKFKGQPGKTDGFPDAHTGPGEADAIAGGKGSFEFDFTAAIVYEDEDVIIVNKPAGILSQKAKPEDVSVNEYLAEYCLAKGIITKEELATFRPSVCNRLDRNTSGLLTCGVSLKGQRELSRLIRERKLEKYYICVVEGSVSEGAHLTSYLKKDHETNKVEVRKDPFPDADKVELEYRPLGKEAGETVTTGDLNKSGKQVRNGKEYTILEVRLLTGKSHQIRAQLAAIGHPIAGDPKYGSKTEAAASQNGLLPRNIKSSGTGKSLGLYTSSGGSRAQLLCAYRLVFPPDTELTRLAGREFRLE